MNKSAPLIRHKGFTLIEVMVAMAIIAIALASLIKASGNHTHSAAYLKSKTLAHYVAMNEITQIQINKTWLDLGTSHGSYEMADIEWFWTREVQKTEDKNTRSIKFTVYIDEDKEQNLTQVQAYTSNPASNKPATTGNNGNTGGNTP